MLMQLTDSLELSAVVRREGRLYVALCPEFDVASQGKSVEEALKNLKEALELFLEDEDADLSSLGELLMFAVFRIDVHRSFSGSSD